MTLKKISFLFPGQGSQFVGMGRDLAETIPAAREIFSQADEVCSRPVSRLCFEGPMEELTRTENLQPAITAVNLACLEALREAGIRADVSAGHSLGEYAALVSGGVVSARDALRLVRKRGEVMDREAQAHPGSMAAVMGLDLETVKEIVSEASDAGVVAVANHNTLRQIVITGERGAVSKAANLVRERKGKAIPLKVSGAWHCSLMAEGVSELREFMEQIPFEVPKTPILFNATAREESDPAAIRDIMARQLTGPVYWYGIIERMLEEGVDVFVEVGPKKVLTGLLKKILPSDSPARVYNVEGKESLERVVQALG
ncbi:MAG: ACP S-malonyltransferase [Deltaproteobacteria bacterium]|nr:ACP S-malonyltransferase [Deltaproteobacteria bacterium]